MVLNSFLIILSGLLRGLDDFLTVYWDCLMNNCGRSLLRAEWSRTAKKLTSWLFGILLVQIRIVGQGPKCVCVWGGGGGGELHPGTILCFNPPTGDLGQVGWSPVKITMPINFPSNFGHV